MTDNPADVVRDGDHRELQAYARILEAQLDDRERAIADQAEDIRTLEAQLAEARARAQDEAVLAANARAQTKEVQAENTRLRQELAEAMDFKAEIVVDAYTAPDAAWGTILDSLRSRIADKDERIAALERVVEAARGVVKWPTEGDLLSNAWNAKLRTALAALDEGVVVSPEHIHSMVSDNGKQWHCSECAYTDEGSEK